MTLHIDEINQSPMVIGNGRIVSISLNILITLSLDILLLIGIIIISLILLLG